MTDGDDDDRYEAVANSAVFAAICLVLFLALLLGLIVWKVATGVAE